MRFPLGLLLALILIQDPAPPKDLLGDPLPRGALVRFGTERWKHDHGAADIVFSADNQTLYTCGFDKIVRAWEVSSGKELFRLEGHTDWIRAIALSPDGAALASAAKDGSVRLWNLKTRKQISSMAGHPTGARSVVFHPMEGLLFSGGEDGAILRWDLSSGTISSTLKGHDEAVLTLAINGDGGLLASGSMDKSVRLWDPKAGTEVRALAGHENFVNCVRFSPDGKFLASASGNNLMGSHEIDHTVRLWNVSTGEQVHHGKDHKAQVSAAAFSKDGKFLISAGIDKTLRLWDIAAKRPAPRFPENIDWIASIAVSPDGKMVATAGDVIRVWDFETGEDLAKTTGHRAFVESIAISADGKRLASASRDRTVRIWEAATGRELLVLHGHKGWVQSVCFSPDGSQVLSAGGLTYEVAGARIWDTATGALILDPDQTGAEFVAYAPDGSMYVIGSHSTLAIRSKTHALLRAIDIGERPVGSRLCSVAFSPDSQSIAFASAKPRVALLDVKTGGEMVQFKGHEGNPDDAICLAFSPAGKMLATGSRDKTARLWDVCTGDQLASLPHDGEIYSVAFSQDGRLLATGCLDGALRIWEVASAGLVLKISPGAWVLPVAFAPDGRSVASGMMNGLVYSWSLEPGEASKDRDLADKDPSAAYKSVWALVKAGVPSIPALKAIATRTSPIPASAAQLIASLGAEDPAERDRATTELSRMGASVEPELMKALAADLPAESKARIRKILEIFEKPIPLPLPMIARVRAIWALEMLGATEALESIAKESVSERSKREAEAAIKRLKR